VCAKCEYSKYVLSSMRHSEWSLGGLFGLMHRDGNNKAACVLMCPYILEHELAMQEFDEDG